MLLDKSLFIFVVQSEKHFLVVVSEIVNPYCAVSATLKGHRLHNFVISLNFSHTFKVVKCWVHKSSAVFVVVTLGIQKFI